MTAPSLAELPNAFTIEIRGTDAVKVVNNLCTNDINRLADGSGAETFVTDLRGWVVAHGIVVKRPDCITLLGSHTQPESIANHIDRYIIREDAQVSDLSMNKSILLLDGVDNQGLLERLSGQDISDPQATWDLNIAGKPVLAAKLPVTGSHAIGLVCDREQTLVLQEELVAAGCILCTPAEFQSRRIANRWPLSPWDIREKTIPQELDRDATAISFTKGCYLGQETIARLDARGQLQKKLCLLEAPQSNPPLQPTDGVLLGDKQVGQLTSVAVSPDNNRTLALAFLKRGNFESGTQLSCQNVSVVVI